MFTLQDIDDVNRLSTFLANDQGRPTSILPGDVYILAGSAILDTISATFLHLSNRQEKATLILAGGKGHSTNLLYDAVALHPTYGTIDASSYRHLAESRVMELLIFRFFPILARKN